MRTSLFLLALLLVGCSDGDSGSSRHVEHVPAISNFMLSPSSVAQMSGDGQVTVTLDLSFQDAGKDIQTLWIQMPDGARMPFVEASPDATGSLREQVAMSTKTIGKFAVEVWLVDRAGDTSNRLVANIDVVGDSSLDRWTKRLSGLPYSLNDVAWTGNGFVAVGGGGKILASADGIDWTERSSPTTYDLNAVASLGSDVVAVGDRSTVLLSTDRGATWSTGQTGNLYYLRAVVITSSQILAGGTDEEGDALILKSTDRGESWKVVDTLPQTDHFITGLVHANGLFVAATDVMSWESDTRVMVSTDGDVWHDIVLQEQAAGLYALLHDGQQFIVAGGDATVFASRDGYNWTHLQTPVDRVDYLGAAWNGNRLVLAGGITWWYWWFGTPSFERPVGLSSTDGGVSWGPFNIDGYYESHGLAWGNGRFVSVGQENADSTKGAIYTSN